MDLEAVLDRCHGFEMRAAAAYRNFAAGARGQPELCTLWTQLAREEEEHAKSIARARGLLGLKGTSRVAVDGWDEVFAEVERCLAAAERLGAAASPATQLAAALDLEMTELETARHAVLDASHVPVPAEQADHAERLARIAETFREDPHLQLQVALLRARDRLASG